MKLFGNNKKKSYNINYTLKHDLCTGCGICYGACPKNAVSITAIKGVFRPKVDDNLCNHCGKCLKVCPGISANLITGAKTLFSDVGIQNNIYIGRYLQCYIGHSCDNELRTQASSGGMISQFLIWLLENKKIDGALVTAFDKYSPLKIKTYIARTKEEVLKAKGSKYAPVSLHEGIKQLKTTETGKYVVVGVPCHVQGVRKLMAIDKNLREKIIGVFSLFCSGSQTFNYTEYILKQLGGSVEGLSYLAYREGCPSGMVAKGPNFEIFKEYTLYNRPLKSTFYQSRCCLCVDMFGELADISFGDIHLKDKMVFGNGVNAMIVRNSNWLILLQEAAHEGVIKITKITVDQFSYKRTMTMVKKNRNASFVALLKKLHIVAPNYDSDYSPKVNIKIALRYCFISTKQFIGNHKCLWFLLPKIK